MKNGWKLVISLREQTPPSFVFRKDVFNSTLCDFFSERQGNHPSINAGYHNTQRFVFYLSTKRCDLSNLFIKFTSFDKIRGETVKTMELSSKDCFMPKNLLSQNYLFFPTEKYLIHWDSNVNNFKVYCVTDIQKTPFTFIHFHFTKKFGLMFWFDKKCYVGRIEGMFLRLIPFDRFDINFITQFFNVVYCEQNDELFVIYITSFTSSCILNN